MEIKHIAMIGAGAVGSYIYWGLQHKHDLDLFFVASGDRKKRIEQNGLLINDTFYYPQVKTPEEAYGADLVIVTVKYNSLLEASVDVASIVDDHTLVMSFMNGVDSEEILGNKIGFDHIIYSLIKVSSERKDNSVHFDPEKTVGLIYGEKDGHNQTARIEAVTKLFSDCGLHYRVSDCIINEIWSKFRLNVANNLPQAMLGVGVGAYQDSQHAAFLQQKLREEVEAIAKAKGIDLGAMTGKLAKGCEVPKKARYSTLQDMDAKRHTEIDMFSGVIVRMGKELGIPVPYNEFTFHLIKALEEKNDGRFGYD